ncbi:MAG TPA: glycosyltransferase family 4 protein [Bacteroidia bacterium]|nr:glycosyltransferase family 4 protein [Bacteroidia bacterium]
MKFLFVISSLKGGGAERVLALLANEFSSRKHEVIITTRLSECAYELHSNIQHQTIFKNNENITGIYGKVKFLLRLTNMIKREEPDLIISFMKGMNRKVIMVSKLLNIPVIVSEHINYQSGMNLFSWIERRWIYKMADAVTVLTNYDYEMYYRNFLNNVSVMPNPVTFESIKKLGLRDKTLFVSGNLDRWSHKGFDNLLIVFSNIVKVQPDWKLKIAGSGEKGEIYLSQIVDNLNIKGNVDFLGFCRNIKQELQKSSIFVLSSRYEGFPMVLIEAMSQGCACISFDCVSGPSEIINNEVDGLIVEDQNLYEMEKRILELIEDEKLRERLAISAIENIQRLSIQNIGDKWLSLIDDVIKSNK